jgi:hypothetical protein
METAPLSHSNEKPAGVVHKASYGAIYIATGAKHFNEACVSVVSLKRVMPDLPVTIYTDQPIPAGTPFNERVPIVGCGDGFMDKATYIPHSPYEYTCYLDTDTYVVGDLSNGFELLEYFDFAVAHEPLTAEAYSMPGVPVSFPELNTGVIFFKKSPKTDGFFERWRANYAEDRVQHKGHSLLTDQPSFRQTLYSAPELRLATLPAAYNCRFSFCGIVQGEIKVLHGRLPTGFTPDVLDQVHAVLKRSNAARVYMMGQVWADHKYRFPIIRRGAKPLGRYYGLWEQMRDMARNSLRKRSLLQSVLVGVRYLQGKHR